MSDYETCRGELLDAIRYRLTGERREQFERHLEGCPECRKLFERERELDRALRQRPTFSLPPELRARLAAQVTPEEPKRNRAWAQRWVRVLGPSLAAAALAALVLRTWYVPHPDLM